MGRESLSKRASHLRSSEPVRDSLLALFSAGVVGGLLLPQYGRQWEFPTVVVMFGLLVLVAARSASVAYDDYAESIPLLAMVPFLGVSLTYARYFASTRDDGYVAVFTSFDFYVDVLLGALVSGASWGLAGGLAGYLVGTSVRTLGEAEDVPTKRLAIRLVVVGLATAIVTAVFAWTWVDGGLGDGL